ncbi:hypothetical protein PYCCODRAFT_1037577 [Trametes coccinea BRFM310]|uniref:F-box domain-containing protein n=1 Tax=Trametes coccinea (strain BRFM310) TaxID=1353009 RepID=A0A1Y2IC35_TRAC3|nr:hypothetical protein PYCCODRAFT_1037577 [Trametes coccinea BRFM310]
MTSHRAFSHVDILCEVCEWVDCIPGTRYQTRRTLASLARVCKALHEPAVRLLWRELDSIFQIFLVLPSFVLRRENAEPSPLSTHEEFYNEYHLPADIPAHEWSRLRKYAAYVRAVTFKSRIYCPLYLTSWARGRMEMSHQSWSSIKNLFGDDSVFPNLQRLDWQIAEVDFQFDSLSHFLSPSLRTLVINCQVASRIPVRQEYRDTWSGHLRQLVSDVLRRSPQLAELTLYYGGSLTPAQFFNPLALTPPLSLRSLTIVGPTDKAVDLSDLRILAQIPHLESLTFRKDLEFDDSPTPGHPRCGVTFPHLRSLRFLSRYVATNARYHMLASASLQSLHISSYCFIDASSLQHDCVNWTRSFPSLAHFTCSFNRKEPSDPGATLWYVPHSIPALFAPILALRSIREFSINLANVCALVEDRDLAAFAESWPSLEVLALKTWPYPHGVPESTVGLQGFLSLARGCPRLSMLNLDAVCIDTETLSQAALVSVPTQCTLRTLRVRGVLSPGVRLLLAEHMFPSLAL